MIKKVAAILLLITLILPNVAIAKPADYGTIVWEGTLTNNLNRGEGIKVRYTITGVVGTQISDGKVDIYDRVMKESGFGGGTPHYIIPVVDGSTIKVEYLGIDSTKDYQTSEGVLGMPDSKHIHNYTDEGYNIEDHFYKPKDFFGTEDFTHIFSDNRKEEFATLKRSKMKNPDMIGVIYLPVAPDGYGSTSIRVVTETEAKKMLREISNGHATRTIGKKFAETKERDDIFYRKFKSLTEKQLEAKYGIKDIYIKDGFYPKEQLLVMLDKIYSRFPNGLIKEVTSYYKSKGINTYIRFTEKKDKLSGHFSDSNGRVTINYYTSIFNDFGDWVIAHEMGHYIHKYLNEKYGYTKLKNEWVALNDDIQYDSEAFTKGYIEDKELNYFVRDYGKTCYSEDFATVFELIAGNDPYALKKRVLDNSKLPLKKKVDLLNEVLVKCSSKVTSTKNLWNRAMPDAVSNYAKNTCIAAKNVGIIPEGDRFEGLYTTYISREDFALLAINLMELDSGKKLQDICREKGVDKEYYHNVSLSAIPGEDGSTQGRVRSNYAFCDITNYNIFDLSNLGIISGVSDKIFDPEGLLTREQAAAILRNIAKVLGKDLSSKDMNFVDENKMESWAISGINFVASNGLMNGYNNKFNPKSKITYEQTYIILYNFFNKLD